MTQAILKLCITLDLKLMKKGEFLTTLYKRLWNPVNYAIVGGIGVLINFLVWIILLKMGFQWWITNIAAILFAWIWNWSNSVGPFGYLWGFAKRKK